MVIESWLKNNFCKISSLKTVTWVWYFFIGSDSGSMDLIVVSLYLIHGGILVYLSVFGIVTPAFGGMCWFF